MVTEYELAKAENALVRRREQHVYPDTGRNSPVPLYFASVTKPTTPMQTASQTLKDRVAISTLGVVFAVALLGSSGMISAGDMIKARQSVLGKSDTPALASRVTAYFNQLRQSNDVVAKPLSKENVPPPVFTFESDAYVLPAVVNNEIQVSHLRR